jgi:hypothetical protein
LRIFISFFFIFYPAVNISHAAPLLYRVQQQKAVKQQQSQDQYQEYLEHQQQGKKAQGQQAAVQQTYQQTVDQRNQAIAQAILDAHNQSVSSKDSQVNAPADQVERRAFQAVPADAKEVVDLSEVWKKLDKKSAVWSLLMDDQAKMLTVSEYIDRFHREGVKINHPPLHYVQMIDQIVGENPQMLQRPFGELVQIVAIVDYDFDNGMNKDDLARKVLGEAGFEANKKRFSQ